MFPYLVALVSLHVPEQNDLRRRCLLWRARCAAPRYQGLNSAFMAGMVTLGQYLVQQEYFSFLHGDSSSSV